MKYLSALVAGKAFEPIEIPFSKKVSDDFATFENEQTLLLRHSKLKTGYGYAIEYQKVRNKKHGLQDLPQRICFETEEDLLRFLKKRTEADNYKKNVSRILQEFPMLQAWLSAHPAKVVEYDSEWTDILKVLANFNEHPHPNLYIRELPVEVHTKFIETHKQILAPLLDIILEGRLAAEESDFERRYHLKYAQSLVRLRILDNELSQRYFSGISDMSLPISDCALLHIPVARVFVVENKINFLTFPPCPGSILFWGKGFNVAALKDIPLLQTVPLYYWGDLDAQGFEILSQMRSYIPQTKSILMDKNTFEHYFQHDEGTPSKVSTPLHLTAQENELYALLKTNNWRLEQEKIPQKEITELLKHL